MEQETGLEMLESELKEKGVVETIKSEANLIKVSQDLQTKNKYLNELVGQLKNLKLQKKEDKTFYMNANKVLTENEKLKDLLHWTLKITMEDTFSENVVINCLFKNGQAKVKFLYQIVYGSFILDDMKPKHKNFENMKLALLESQDIQGFMLQLTLYFDKILQTNDKENIENSK